MTGLHSSTLQFRITTHPLITTGFHDWVRPKWVSRLGFTTGFHDWVRPKWVSRLGCRSCVERQLGEGGGGKREEEERGGQMREK
ncbi:hypothetical protein FH972_006945 [Carpinus fangiana]|uniref:Uncharacterized protein n=1 Tax=Carpinus fangiana TaxID=176857 RepID=A0A5N6QVN9_9ROSI|nr:hypothetical protein FH972_006945 [Carpinus fangiana]